MCIAKTTADCNKSGTGIGEEPGRATWHEMSRLALGWRWYMLRTTGWSESAEEPPIVSPVLVVELNRAPFHWAFSAKSWYLHQRLAPVGGFRWQMDYYSYITFLLSPLIHPLIHTVVEEASMQGAACSSGTIHTLTPMEVQNLRQGQFASVDCRDRPISCLMSGQPLNHSYLIKMLPSSHLTCSVMRRSDENICCWGINLFVSCWIW